MWARQAGALCVGASACEPGCKRAGINRTTVVRSRYAVALVKITVEETTLLLKFEKSMARKMSPK